MKKLLYLLSMVAVIAMMAACGSKKDDVEDGTEEGGGSTSATVEPTRIVISESQREFNMAEGEETQIAYTVSPANVNVKYTLVWTSSKESVATVDNTGKVKAVGEGSTTIKVSIKEYSDVKPATAQITVLEPAKVGDFIYSDGTWGDKTVVDGKEIIALVYWNGNPTLYDPILAQDYKNCTHGLAMSLKQGKVGQWQQKFMEYYLGTSSTSDYDKIANSAFCNDAGNMTEWIISKSSFGELAAPYIEKEELRVGNMYCGVGGFTLTRAMEEFMTSEPKASDFPLDIYNNTMELVKTLPEHPATTSSWYIPGIYEAALMVNTALTKPMDFNNTQKDGDGNPLIKHNNANIGFLNNILSKVSTADQLPTEKGWAIASASDAYFPYSMILGSLGIDCGDYFRYLVVSQGSDEGTDDEKAERDKAWKEWVEENVPADKQATYLAYKTHTERGEAYLAIKGYSELSPSDLDGATFVWALSLFGTLVYANVGVTDGMMHNSGLFLSGEYKEYSGAKGYDNPKDVVRAVIAF